MRIHTYLLLLVAAFALASCKPAEPTAGSSTTTDTKTATPGTTTPGTTTGTTTADASKLIGTWVNEEAKAGGASQEFTFKADGNFELNMSMKAQDGKATISNKTMGSFTTKGNSLSMHFASAVVSSADADAATKKIIDKQNEDAKKSLATAADAVSTISFKDDSTLVLTAQPPKENAGAPPAVLTLKKKA